MSIIISLSSPSSHAHPPAWTLFALVDAVMAVFGPSAAVSVKVVR